jgi:ATP phosphoribosyltransferase
MKTMIEIADAAERILVPPGKEMAACILAFSELTGIEVPDFNGRNDMVRSGGRTFWQQRGKDIPLRISEGVADIGLTGLDACEDAAGEIAINYQPFGDIMCRFALLVPNGTESRIRERLDERSRPVLAISSRPRLTDRCAAMSDLNLMAVGRKITGRVEGAVSLCGEEAAADIVESGETARANSLVIVKDLLQIYPTIVWASQNSERAVQKQPTTFEGVSAIDKTLRTRLTQVDDRTLRSYTLDLMRDENERNKKFGSEAAEFLTARTPTEKLLELADTVYAGVTDLVTISGGEFGLGDVLQELVRRNIVLSTGSRRG